MVECTREDLALLTAAVKKEDSCWEERIKCVFRVFLLTQGPEGAKTAVGESVSLHCLLIFGGMTAGWQQAASNTAPRKTLSYRGVQMDVSKWLGGDPEHSFQTWDRKAKVTTTNKSQGRKMVVRHRYLAEKYAKLWMEKSLRGWREFSPLELPRPEWLKTALFR